MGKNTVAACPKCGGRGVLGVRFLLCFFENESRPCLQEGRERNLKREKRAQVRVGVSESTEKGEDKGLITDRLADVGEGVGKGLQLGAVVTNGEIALRSVAELRLQLNCAVLLVVAEQILDGVPDGAGGGAGAHDDAEKIDGDRAVDPGEHRVVVTPPVG